jgi:hypothetical protein
LDEEPDETGTGKTLQRLQTKSPAAYAVAQGGVMKNDNPKTIFDPQEFKYQQVDEESRKRWMEGIAKFKKAMSEAAPETLRRMRERAAEIARLSQERWFG